MCIMEKTPKQLLFGELSYPDDLYLIQLILEIKQMLGFPSTEKLEFPLTIAFIGAILIAGIVHITLINNESV